MNRIDSKGKKLIYVVACGRSGTTILGYLLGNARGALDLGEVNEWLRFDGKPNGFEAGTDNYEFWDKVMNRFIELGGIGDFDALRSLQRRIDYHYAMLGQIITGFRHRRKECNEFRVFLIALYQAIIDVSDARILVDSSKYPSRLWHLVQIYPPEDLYVVHLRRSAKSVIEAMQSNGQGKPRSKLIATAYYYGVEFLVDQVLKKLQPSQVTEIKYEYLMKRPEDCLESLGEQFNLDVRDVIEKVQRGEPLRRGQVFNGNRMRMQDRVIFRKK